MKTRNLRQESERPINPHAIREKFGDDYLADERAYVMGIDQRFTKHFAERFFGLSVLETCAGAGFTTISLARTARHVYAVEIDESIQEKAIKNIRKAGLSSKVSFISGSILDPKILKGLPAIDAAFIDPDWAVTGPGHEYRFLDSNTKPPADVVLKNMLEVTNQVAIILPPLTKVEEFEGLPEHECERLFLGKSHELFCLYFGDLIRSTGMSEFIVA